MSYNKNDALADQEEAIEHALEEGNQEQLRHWAHVLAGAGDEERGLQLLEAAERIRRDEWAFDEARDNREI